MRAIDADEFMKRLILDTSKGHYGEFMDGSEVAYTSKEIAQFVSEMPTLTPPNEPLTIEQLREMDGEPVWCKWLLPEDRAIEQGKWFIVISGDKAGLEIKRPAEYGCHFCKIDECGKTWLAYRRPPEGEVDNNG